ncbi:MAG: hypothetical protein AB8G99_23675 [Planctomycetaceae bacterium]
MMLSNKLQLFLTAGLILSWSADTVSAQVVPGSGRRINEVGDDFEDEKWNWVFNGPKASKEQDEQIRQPLGYSTNRRWFESPKRGNPDILRRVDTPPGGIKGSKGSLLIQTVNAGVPNFYSYKMMQDDLVLSCASRVGMLPVSRTPQAVVRVYFPPYKEWENRTGTHFGYRIDLKTTKYEQQQSRRFLRTFSSSVPVTEAYWPGFFVEFHSETDAKYKTDSARLLIRGNHLGREVPSKDITPGWWTLGMSATPDGQVHFYASPGVDNLKSTDYLYTSRPYGYSAEKFATQFFNVCNKDDGKTWSTGFIIDDPAVYVAQ